MANFKHVDQAVALGWEREYFGYFAEPGTGKTRMALLDARKNHEAGLIDAVIVVAKNSGKTNWVIWPHMIEDPVEDIDQVERVLGTDVIKGVWINGGSAKDRKEWENFEKAIDHPKGKLIVFSLNYEALLGNQLFEFLRAFMKRYRTMIVADESTRIGKPGSQRTKRALKLRPLAPKRRILSGSPILKSPMKIFSQAMFLHPNAIGFTSQYAFRNRYCTLQPVIKRNGQPLKSARGQTIMNVSGYQNLEELSDKIAKFSFRIQAKDCLDLPKQRFMKRRVYMTTEQTRAYNEMRKEFITNVKGNEVSATIVLTQMMRLQQILGGYATTPDGRVIEIVPPDKNPKITEAFEIIEDAPGQCIVWCRFKPEIKALASMLDEAGISYYEFHGDITSAEERVRIRKSFQRGERQVILATTSTGGDSIDEFKVATTAIFVSNDHDTEMRVQAERRTWRAGMDVEKSIAYFDILIPNTVDTKIMAVLRGDATISSQIMRDKLQEWI